MQTIKIDLYPDAGVVSQNIARLLERQMRERSHVELVRDGVADLTLQLRIEAGIGTEGYRIEDAADGAIRITGNDERGLLYGAGKLLRACSFQVDRVIAGSWRGMSVPQKPMRGIYFATHFHNFYHDAPLAEVERYTQDLAL